jgi:hypothetical protein
MYVYKKVRPCVVYICQQSVVSYRYKQKMAAVNGSGRYLCLNQYCSPDLCRITITSGQQHPIFHCAIFVELFNFAVCTFRGTVIWKFPSMAEQYNSGHMDYLPAW